MHNVSNNELQNAVDKIAKLAVKKSVKNEANALYGVQVTIDSYGVELVATDRYRVGRYVFAGDFQKTQQDGTDYAPRTTLVDANALKQIVKSFGAKVRVTVSIDDDGFLVIGSDMVTAKIHKMDHAYPAVGKILDPSSYDQFATTYTVKRSDLISVVKDTIPHLEKNAPLVVKFKQGGIWGSALHGKDLFYHKAFEHDGPDITVGLPPQRLVDALSTFDGDEVTLTFYDDPKRPVFFTEYGASAKSNLTKHVLMPIRIPTAMPREVIEP